jgi:hypothetical protein
MRMEMRRSKRDGQRRGLLLGLACLVGLSGCYRTVELDTLTPEPGTRIVADLTPTGAERMQAWIGADAVAVEGRVTETGPQGWELSLLRVDHHRAPSIRWSGEQVVFPSEVLRGVRERRLDALRTGAFAAGTGVVLVILARNFMGAFVSDDNGGGGTDPVN